MSAPNKVVVARERILFPNLCPVCLSAGPSSVQSITSDYGKLSGYYVLFTTKKHLVMQIALCTSCARKERRLQKYSSTLTVFGLLAAVGVAVSYNWGGMAWVLGIAFCAPGILLSELIGKPVRVGRYDANSVELAFKSSAYAEQFRALNQCQ
jgi:hypothetical protein